MLYEAPIQALRDDVAALGLGSDPTLHQSLSEETTAIEFRLAQHGAAAAQLTEGRQTVANLQRQLESVNTQIAAGESRAGTLATGFVALRDQASEGICPVCDRDYSEVSDGHLLDHIDRKIADLASVGAEIQLLSDERTQLTTRLHASQQGVSAAEASVLTEAEHDELTARHLAAARLQDGLEVLADSIARGQELQAAAENAARELADTEAEDREQRSVAEELARYAAEIGTTAPGLLEPPEDTWTRLHDLASNRSQELDRHSRSSSEAKALLGNVSSSTTSRSN